MEKHCSRKDGSIISKSCFCFMTTAEEGLTALSDGNNLVVNALLLCNSRKNRIE